MSECEPKYSYITKLGLKYETNLNKTWTRQQRLQWKKLDNRNMRLYCMYQTIGVTWHKPTNYNMIHWTKAPIGVFDLKQCCRRPIDSKAYGFICSLIVLAVLLCHTPVGQHSATSTRKHLVRTRFMNKRTIWQDRNQDKKIKNIRQETKPKNQRDRKFEALFMSAVLKWYVNVLIVTGQIY